LRTNGVSLYWLMRVILRFRASLMWYCVVGFFVGLTVILVRRPQYTSSFAFLPQAGQDPSKAAGLASLAGQFGISLGALGGSSQPPQLYADLLTTREVLLPIAKDSFDVELGSRRTRLPDFLKVRESTEPLILDKTLRILRRDVISSVVATRTTGMVTVNVRTHSPVVSLRIAERLLDGLNRFNLVTRQSQASEERRFTESRFEASRVALREAENRLQAFLQQNRQYSNSPQLSFERDRLQSDVSLRQQVYQSLAQQYEDARIKEVRDTPVITVIEKPILPARPDPQLRAWILGISVIAGGLLGLLVAMFRTSRAERIEAEFDPEQRAFREEWTRLRGRAP
jgi:uncharacterized protein involved in exopolysaccharide biosynthesis